MRRTRIAGLCLLAVIAMSTVASATASAEAPEFGQCIKVSGANSNYSDAKCTNEVAEGTGKYEWAPGVKSGENSFETASIGAVTWETVKGESVACTAEESTGTYKLGGNNKEESTALTLKGCAASGLTCTSTGKQAGEIVTNPLTGIVGFEKEPKEADKMRKTVLQLHAAVSGGRIAEFKCTSALTIEWRGNGPKEGVLVQIKNDAMTSTETLKYAASKGVQKPSKWFPPEAGYGEAQFLELNYNGTGFTQFGLTYTTKVTNEGGVKYEINAFV